MKSFVEYIKEQVLNELGDTEQGRSALKSYKRKAKERESIAKRAAPVFLIRASDPNAIESPAVNLKKYYKYSRISTNKGRGIARVNKILGLKDE